MNFYTIQAVNIKHASPESLLHEFTKRSDLHEISYKKLAYFK